MAAVPLVGLAIGVIGLVGGCAVYLSAKRRLEAPDLERWHAAGDGPGPAPRR